MLDGVEFIHHNDIAQMYLNNVWRANLSITGADGLPDASKAGNVLRASTSVRLSLRLSPVFDCEKAIELLETSNHSLTEIAYLTGFSDQSHFTRIFKKIRGENPSDFRKNAQKSKVYTKG